VSEAEAKAAVADLLADYAALLDEDRLEDWLELFAEPCRYCILPRENADLGLPQPLMLCENKAMLSDRVVALRRANIFNIHRDRHLVGGPRIRRLGSDTWSLEASYAVYQTDTEGQSRLFSVGSYRDQVVFQAGRPLFRDKLVLADTAAIPTLLATPL